MTTETTQTTAPVAQKTSSAPQQGGQRSFGGGRGRGGSSSRKPSDRPARVKPEFDSKMLSIRRVARVVSGGRRFSFSVALVAGNRKGLVGVGLGKAGDTSLAIDKAMRDAKKHMIKIATTKDMSIPHEVYAKYSSARVRIMPVKDRGLVAGSAVRNILELAGVKNVVAKIVSPSKNKLNIARATLEALSGLNLVKPHRVAKSESKSL